MDLSTPHIGEETVSLTEVLASRDGYLTEEELWAFCREACLTLEYIEGSPDLCQSLSLSPDTLAFDHTGSVCFLDLDMDPDPVYIPPEYEDSCISVKSHLFSVGMSMLYAVRYTTETDNPRPMLGNAITDLLGRLTCDEVTKRPDLHEVIRWCDDALQGKSSQDICLNLCSAFIQTTSIQEGSSILELTSGLSAYLQSQSSLVTSPESNSADHRDGFHGDPRTEHECLAGTSQERVTRASNEKTSSGDDSVVEVRATENEERKQNDSQGDSGVELVSPYKVNVNASYSNKKNSCEEKSEVFPFQEGAESGTKQSSKKKEGMTVNDLLDILDRYLEEQELWALCKEGVVALQRKIKHLPAYISPDTVVVREDGSLSFKPIPEDKPLEVIFMAPELQQKGILSEQTCLYGLGMTLRCAAGHKYSTSTSLPVSQRFENLLVAMLQSNAEKRPTLVETLEACSELEISVKAPASTDVCKHVYHAAITELATPAEQLDYSNHHDEDESELCHLYEQNKDVHEGQSEYENFRASTGHSNTESPWDDNEPAGSDFQPITSPPSAFTPVTATPTKPKAINSQGLNLKPPPHTKTTSDKQTVPIAYSSPSTHFKPIVLQGLVTHKDNSQSSEMKSDVMKKLKDLKEDLLKRKPTNDVGDSDKGAEKSRDGKRGEATVSSQKSDKGDKSLDMLLNRLQSEGQLPNTKDLASAIAQYLQGYTVSESEKTPHTGDLNQSSSLKMSSQAIHPQTNISNSMVQQATSMASSQATNLSAFQASNMIGHPVTGITGYNTSSMIGRHTTGITGHQTNNMIGHLETNMIGFNPASHSFSAAKTPNPIGQNPIQTEPLHVMHSQSSNTFQTIPQTTNLIGQNPFSNYRTSAQTNLIGQNPNEAYQTIQQPANLIGQNLLEGTTTQVYQRPNVAHPQEQPAISLNMVQQHEYSVIPRVNVPQQHEYSVIPRVNVSQQQEYSVISDINMTQQQDRPIIPGVGVGVAGPQPVIAPGLAIPVRYGSNFLPSCPMQLHQDPVTGLMHLVPISVVPYGRLQCPDGRGDDGNSVSDSDRSGHKQKGAEGSVYSYSSSVSETYGCADSLAVDQSNERNASQNSNRSRHSQGCSSVHSDGHSLTSGDDAQHQSRKTNENDKQLSQRCVSRQTPTYENVRVVNHSNNYSGPSPRPKSEYRNYLSPEGLSKSGKYVTGREDNNSNSSSPSPSKDSGVSGLTTSHVHGMQNTDVSLMDRLLSTESIQQQRVLGRVLQLVREECDLERYSTEDLNMAEYITSLVGVKWETFANAVTEKYSDLEWREEVMARLYHIVNDQRSHPAEKYVVKAQATIKEDNKQVNNRNGKGHQRTNSAPGFIIDHSLTNPDHSLTNPGFSTSTPSTQHQHRGSSNLTQSHPGEAKHHKDISEKHHYETIGKASHGSPMRHHYESVNRPHSVCLNKLALCTSETSDSTDTERLEKRRRFKKRYELDRAKSSSLHSLTRSQSVAASPATDGDNKDTLLSSESDYVNQHDVVRPKQEHASKFAGHGHDKENISKSGTVRQNEGYGSRCDSVSQDKGYLSKPDNGSKPEGYVSKFHNIGRNDDYNSKPDNVVKSEQYVSSYHNVHQEKEVISNVDRISLQASEAKPSKPNTNRNLNSTQTSSLHPTTVNNDNAILPVSRNNTQRECDSGAERCKQEMPSSHHTSASVAPGNASHTNTVNAPPVRSAHASSAPRQTALYGRAERGPGKAAPCSSAASVVPRNPPPQYGMSSGFSSTRPRPQRHTADSSTAVHTGGTTGVKYPQRDAVVYHWAMTQLHQVQEIIDFLQTIEPDEENKERLEHRLKQTQQEIDVVRKQRRKTQKLYHKLTTSKTNNSNKGEQTPVSGQMLKDLSEMTKTLRLLTLCKTHLEMLLCELYGLDECFLYSLATSLPSQPLTLRPYESNPSLQFQCVNKPLIGCEMRVLQAGETEGLLAYLYVSSALSDGYVQQFLYCFRYFLTAEQVLDFIIDKYTSSLKVTSSDKNLIRVRQRSLDLLAFWVEGFYSIDFHHNAPLIGRLETFLKSICSSDESRSHELLTLLDVCRAGHHLELCSADDVNDDDESPGYFIHVTLNKKSLEERLMEILLHSNSLAVGHNTASINGAVNPSWRPHPNHCYTAADTKAVWDSFRSSKRAKMAPKIMNGISAAETKTMEQFKMAASLMDLTPVALSWRSENLIITDYTPASLVEQLTLLEQEMFAQTHPVHYLNSKAHGVGVALSMQGQRTPLLPRKKDEPVAHNMFVSDPPRDPVIHHWITHNQDVSHWVAAEIIASHSAKSQMAVLSKFIQMAQLCADVRNFATCLSVLGGLENLIVRQLPIWKNLPAKCVSTMEQLATLKMQLKSDPDILMKEKDSYLLPTIPSVLYFLLHVQQLEIGGFRLANGMYKWGKMRSISQMIDMIRLFRNNEYLFERDAPLLDLLRQRVLEFRDKDLQAIAASSDFNMQRVGSKGIHGALRKIKDKLQSKGSK